MSTCSEHTAQNDEAICHTGIVCWPAIIHFQGDAELVCVRSQSEWQNTPHLSAACYQPEDMLIDACGAIFTLAQRENGIVSLTPSGRRLTLEHVLRLIRMHAAQDGACCVAKLSAASIVEAISMLQ
jgi:hypothetical protein